MKNNPLEIIALHGAGMGPAAFDALKGHMAFTAPVLPATPSVADTTALPSIAEMAAAVRIAGPCILMGHSMGALVALEAAKNPAVRGVILMGVAAEMPVHPDLLKQALETPEAAGALVLKWSVASGDEVRARLKDGMNPSALHAGLSACDAYKNGADAARALDKPALVIAGGKDKMVKPEKSEALAALLPQGHFVTLPDSGHMMMAEDPKGTAAEIDAFVRGISGV